MENKNFKNNHVDSNRKTGADVQRRRREHAHNSARAVDQQQQQQQQQRAAIQNAPAKIRNNVDKRARQRGVGNFSDASANTSVTDLLSSSGAGLALANKATKAQMKSELNSVYDRGSKKHNLNHLLNFHYAPRETDFNGHGGHSVFGANFELAAGRYANKVKKVQQFNKEQFLQANFQFVINANAKPNICGSPDELIDWQLIEQINIQTTEEPQCPICLYPPVAAKITRCGHAFCWLCMLHYLSLSDKTWRKCPICYDAIHIGDLKSTAIIQQRNYAVGSAIEFRLMRRKKGSMFIEHYAGAASDNTSAAAVVEHFPLVSQSDDASFSKFIIATHADVLQIIDREQRELLDSADADNPTYVFVQMAMNLLNERRAKLADNSVVDYADAAKPSTIDNSVKQSLEHVAVEHAEVAQEPNTATCSKYYYFYQSEDGQNVFLHPLNVKMLLTCYDALANAPVSIKANILEKEYHSMDEELRRKFTCLGHLPLTCQFIIVEVDLQPPVITSDALRLFKDDVLMRKMKRQRRDKEERKREKKINEFNDKQIGKLISSTASLNLTSESEFPLCGFDEPLPTASGAQQQHQATTSVVANPNIWLTGNILPKMELWPTLGTSSAVNNGAAVYYQELSTIGRNRTRTTSTRSSDGGESVGTADLHVDNCSVAKLNVTLSDVLSEAISKKQKQPGAQATQPSNHAAAATAATSSNKKNKKNKKMVPLFSTAMNFHNK